MTDSLQNESLSLFNGKPQHDAFRRMSDFFPTSALAPSPEPQPLPTGPPLELPETHDFDGATRPAADFLANADTAALLVLHDGAVRFEQYWLTGGPDVQWISWSAAKSFVSALIGIAVHEGDISSIDDTVSSYVPELAGSAYDGVSTKHVLQMSSGARWNEDYSDPESTSLASEP